MAKPKKHWSGGFSDLRLGCEREPGTRHGSIEHRTWSASMFVERSASAPDHYCVPCTKAARLALAAESAPKPSDVVWPKPRPISEAPTDGSCVLGHWSVSGYPRLRGCRWAVVKPGSGLAWFNEQNEPLSEPDYFLPLPPEVN